VEGELVARGVVHPQIFGLAVRIGKILKKYGIFLHCRLNLTGILYTEWETQVQIGYLWIPMPKSRNISPRMGKMLPMGAVASIFIPIFLPSK